MEEDYAVTILTLDPKNKWEFLTAMSRAWEWAQRRKRFYCDRGGYQSLEDYLQEAAADDTKQLAVMDDGRLCAVLTVQLAYEGIFQIHVTAERKASRQAILDALLWLRDELFERRNARQIWTSCATHRGHHNAASYALAEACGMTPSGIEWQSEHDPQTTWQEYCLTREDHGRTKSND